jgi:hypothetical protein
VVETEERNHLGGEPDCPAAGAVPPAAGLRSPRRSLWGRSPPSRSSFRHVAPRLHALQQRRALEPLPWNSNQTGSDVILVRRDLLPSPAIDQLIQAIRAACRHHFAALAGLDWTGLEPLNSHHPDAPCSPACASC